ncbi:hypothetical protein Hte_002598 [Hypoxylon texense]
MAPSEDEQHSPNNGEHGANNQSHPVSENVPVEEDRDLGDAAPSHQSPRDSHSPSSSSAQRLSAIPEMELPEADEASCTLSDDDQSGEDGEDEFVEGAEDEADDGQDTLWCTQVKYSDSGDVSEMGSWAERERVIRSLPDINIPPPGSDLGPPIRGPCPWSDRSLIPPPPSEHLRVSSIQLPRALPPRGLLPLPSKRGPPARLPRKLLRVPVLPGFPPVPSVLERPTSRSLDPDPEARSNHSGHPLELHLPDPSSSLDPDRNPHSKQTQRKAKVSQKQKGKEAESADGKDSNNPDQADSSKSTEASTAHLGHASSNEPTIWELRDRDPEDVCDLIETFELTNDILKRVANAKRRSKQERASLEMLRESEEYIPPDLSFLDTLFTMVDTRETGSSGEQAIPIRDESQDLPLKKTDQNASRDTTVDDSSGKTDTGPKKNESVTKHDSMVASTQKVSTESEAVDLPEEHSAHVPEPLEARSTKTDAPVPAPSLRGGPDRPNEADSEAKSRQEDEEATAVNISRKKEKAAKARERKKKKAAEEWEKKKRAEQIKQAMKEKRRIEQEKAEQRRIEQEKAEQTKTILKKPDDPPQQTDSDAKGKEVKKYLLEREPKQIEGNGPRKEIENRAHGKEPRDDKQPMQSTAPEKYPDEDKDKVKHPQKDAVTTNWEMVKRRESLDDRKHLRDHLPPKPGFQSQQMSLDPKPRPEPRSGSKSQPSAELRVGQVKRSQPQPSRRQQAVSRSSHSETQPTKPQPSRQGQAFRQPLSSKVQPTRPPPLSQGQAVSQVQAVLREIRRIHLQPSHQVQDARQPPHSGVPPSQPQPNPQREAVHQPLRSEIQSDQPQLIHQAEDIRQPWRSETQSTHLQSGLQGQADFQPSHSEIQPTYSQRSHRNVVVRLPPHPEVLPFQPEPSVQQEPIPQPSSSEIQPIHTPSVCEVKPPSQPQIVSQPEHQAQNLPVSRPENSSVSPLPPSRPLQMVSPNPPALEGEAPMMDAGYVSGEQYQNLRNDYRRLEGIYQRLEDSYRILFMQNEDLRDQNKDLHGQNKDLYNQNKDLFIRNAQLSNQENESLVKRSPAEKQRPGGVTRPPGLVDSDTSPYHHGSTNLPTRGNSDLGSHINEVERNAEAASRNRPSLLSYLEPSAPSRGQYTEHPQPRATHYGFRNQPHQTHQTNVRAAEGLWEPKGEHRKIPEEIPKEKLKGKSKAKPEEKSGATFEEERAAGPTAVEKEEGDEYVRRSYVYRLPRGERKVSI